MTWPEIVLQKAFIQTWRDARNFGRRRASAMTWMTAITRHRALGRLRRKLPEVALDEEESLAPLMSDEAIGIEVDWTASKALDACMDTLSEKQQVSIALAVLSWPHPSEVERSAGDTHRYGQKLDRVWSAL